mgnify:CR=1 FL=1
MRAKKVRRIAKSTYLKHMRKKIVRSQKVFCIGSNKTGTTSMAKIFKQLGYIVGSQSEFEVLIHDWYNNRFDRIIRAVKYKGTAFQDIPFSLPKTYKVLDQNFPNSKFILTVRDSEDEWYQSVIRYESLRYGDGNLPTKENLQRAKYHYHGWVWERNRMTNNTPEDDIYNEQILKESYLQYNQSVKKYFKDQPDILLVINLKDPEANVEICNFLNAKKIIEEVPWENRTQPNI